MTVAVLVAAPTTAAAAGDQEDEPMPAVCGRVKDSPFPLRDQPDAATAQALKGCRSEDLLYGIGHPVDPVKARLCAYLERAAGDELVFGGSAMLMTIYATGVGADQNLDLAIRLACAIEGAPAEIESRVQHLEKLKATSPKEKVKLDLCDDVTSGFMQGHCAAHAHRMTEAKREQRLRALAAAWSPEEREGFKSLREAAAAFIKSRSENEVDLSGTARAALQIEEEETQEKGFDELLAKLGRNNLPRATPATFARADAALNATYKKAMAATALADGTVTKDGVRAAERAWLKYRDAWVTFAKLKFPETDPLATKTWLTNQRAAMIADFLPR